MKYILCFIATITIEKCNANKENRCVGQSFEQTYETVVTVCHKDIYGKVASTANGKFLRREYFGMFKKQ